jgi:hypothetical protein
MSKVLSPRELKRLSREMAGHARDKDRARRKRRASGAMTAAGRPPSQKGHPQPKLDEEPLDEAEDIPAED